MTVKFTLDSIHLGKQIETRELQSNLSDDDIKAMFMLVFGIPFNSITCDYERVKEGD